MSAITPTPAMDPIPTTFRDAVATGTDPPRPVDPTATATRSYPVRLTATLDAPLSRGLWLIKWLLLIPHYIALAVLSVGYLAVSIVAFVAILATGHYPRWAFDYTTGVLRWSWRVQYYGYNALATDRYPPFTLAEVPGYPARLEIDYPEHCSRGKALVQWWLLPIPHFIIVGILLGSRTFSDANDVASAAGVADTSGSSPVPGLIGLLACVAAIVLLFTASYPRSLWALVVGLNRWVFRVTAYVSLMTDRYPPFRLDQGGEEPLAPMPPAASRPTQPVQPMQHTQPLQPMATGTKMPADAPATVTVPMYYPEARS